jgi:hypothetical protein
MANDEHVAMLKQGMIAWNAWREENYDIRPDLEWADLSEESLIGVNLCAANLIRANLDRADFGAADLSEADLRGAHLVGTILIDAKLRKADLRGANLFAADLTRANLDEADLRGAQLGGAHLVDTDFTNADLTGCRIFGISAWGLKLEGAKQNNLVISHYGGDEPEITVDNIEVAQFIYLMLHNPKIRDAIDTIGRKAVLILGRFTPERKAVLDAIREELRNKHDYVPILFDFEKPTSQDLTATVSTLAHLARYIIADLTDPSSIPYELATIVPTTPVPVQPILLRGSTEFAMFDNLRERHPWVLTPYCYDSQMQLIDELVDKVIAPAEAKVKALEERRRIIERELAKSEKRE